MSYLSKNIKNSIKSLFIKKNKQNNDQVLLHEPTFNHEEICAALVPLISTRVTMGKKVFEFEKKYSDKIKSKYSIMCNSGSSANLLMLSSLSSKFVKNNLKPGDEVIVPALSWSTSVWPIIQNNLVPVFVDCSLDTFNLKVDDLKKSLTKKTKAILLVHVYGNPCDMKEIVNFAKKNNLILIEDCCESMGATYNNIPVGNFGLLSSFSLYYSHHITSMEGGICVTKNFELSERMRIMRAHGWSRETERKNYYIKKYKKIDPRFIFLDLGYNLRPTELQAAMATVQLKKLNEIIKKRRANHFKIKKIFLEYEDFFSIQKEQPNSKASWFGFAFNINPKKINYEKFASYLKKNKIENRPVIAGNMLKHPVMTAHKYKKYTSLENSNYIMKNGMAIGCHQSINDIQLAKIKKTIKKYIQFHG
jgi:CDP-4-dehydro-6-deoxyglucose reductase, E1